jgi:hypothetical protein
MDLASGGMKIKTHTYLPEDEHLDFTLLLDRGSVSLKGRVVYSQFLPDTNSVSGIQFVEMSISDQASLQEYLDNLDESAVLA